MRPSNLSHSDAPFPVTGAGPQCEYEAGIQCLLSVGVSINVEVLTCSYST